MVHNCCRTGDASAQLNLGVRHNGDGVPQDDKGAAKWYTLAAKQGMLVQFNLGLMYNDGRGVPQDDKTAVKWYRHAANREMPVPSTI